MQQRWRPRGELQTISGSGLRFRWDNIFNPIHLLYHVFFIRSRAHEDSYVQINAFSHLHWAGADGHRFLYDEGQNMFTLKVAKNRKPRIRVTRIYEPNPIERNIPLFRPSAQFSLGKLPHLPGIRKMNPLRRHLIDISRFRQSINNRRSKLQISFPWWSLH